MKKIGIVGAGLAGLLVANYVERAGAAAIVFDPNPGGLARSPDLGGIPVNLGPHALYRAGALSQALTELGISTCGESPTQSWEWVDGALNRMVTGPSDILRSDSYALTRAQRVVLAACFTRLMLGLHRRQTFAEWAAQWPDFVQLRLAAFVRLATYSQNAVDLPAAIVADQLKLAAKGVRYLHNGWQSVVNQLEERLREPIVAEKVIAVRGCRATVVASKNHQFDHVVLAIPPKRAFELMDQTSGSVSSGEVLCPQTISTLDIATSQPTSGPQFVLGIEEPFYFSDHGRVARFGNQAGVLHVASYTRATRDELEMLADRFAPDWRHHAVGTRYLPQITVSQTLPNHRIGAAVHPRVTFAGDWTDTAGEKFLADATAASSRAAAMRALTGTVDRIEAC